MLSQSRIILEMLRQSVMINEVVILTVDNDGAIATDIQFNHPHIVEVSDTIDGSGFNSSIINNLGYEFTGNNWEYRANSR